jgi:hypothetical protein
MIANLARRDYWSYPMTPHRAINSNLSELSNHVALIMYLLLSQGCNLAAPTATKNAGKQKQRINMAMIIS